MEIQIKEDVYKLADGFVGILNKEYQKYISMQGDVQVVIERHKRNEENRKIEHEQLGRNLDGQKQKAIEAQDRNNKKTDELQAEVEKFNRQNSELNHKLKTTNINLEESETLKKQARKQLDTNREVENKFNDKLKFLKEDENNLEDRKKAVAIREKDATLKERVNKKSELRIAEENIDLQERKDHVKATEERLKIGASVSA